MEFKTSIPPSFFKDFHNVTSDYMEDLETNYSFQGWYTFADKFCQEQTNTQLELMHNDVDYIISIGIGGSYIGLRTLVEFAAQEKKWIFLGPSLDEEAFNKIMAKISGKKLGFLLISKSGNTLEIKTFYSLLKPLMQTAEWISVITSYPSFYKEVASQLKRPVLHFPIDEKTGGRYSIMSYMGVVGVYLLGYQPRDVFTAVLDEKQNFLQCFHQHPAFFRGVGRYLLQKIYGVSIEFLSTKNITLKNLLKWSEQLFAESDGKQGKGLYIGRAFYPQDAHSIGQMMAEGKKIVAETFYLFKPMMQTQTYIEEYSTSLDNLNHIFINGILQSRKQRGMVVQSYTIDKDIKDIFRVFFCEMLSISLESYLLQLNPFDQPGVEGYKACIQEQLKNYEISI